MFRKTTVLFGLAFMFVFFDRFFDYIMRKFFYNLQGSNHQEVNLRGIDLQKTKLDTILISFTSLAEVKNRNLFKYISPISTNYNKLIPSKNLPRTFLGRIKLGTAFTEHFPSSQKEPSRYYSCFIAYVEADNEFAYKIRKSFQKNNVSCWLWREDITWGKNMRAEIDRAIYQKDKLLVICSELSLNSPQVVREIERAIQKEDQLRKTNPEIEVLFPISIDDYLSNWKHYLQPYLRLNAVADFRDWQHPSKYQNSITRLINALKRPIDP